MPFILILPVKYHSHPGVIREALPGVPLYPIPLSEAKDTLKRGAHLVYQVCGELYRPCYKSALVLEVEDLRIHVIKNSSDGVKTEWLDFTDSHFIVAYSHCHYTDDEAVERAEQRLKWGENRYHCLNNNSHHFVTWAKTGRENALADIIESLMYQKGDVMCACVNVCAGGRGERSRGLQSSTYTVCTAGPYLYRNILLVDDSR